MTGVRMDSAKMVKDARKLVEERLHYFECYGPVGKLVLVVGNRWKEACGCAEAERLLSFTPASHAWLAQAEPTYTTAGRGGSSSGNADNASGHASANASAGKRSDGSMGSRAHIKLEATIRDHRSEHYIRCASLLAGQSYTTRKSQCAAAYATAAAGTAPPFARAEATTIVQSQPKAQPRSNLGEQQPRSNVGEQHEIIDEVTEEKTEYQPLEGPAVGREELGSAGAAAASAGTCLLGAGEANAGAWAADINAAV
jgi:hypothetical protein